VRTRDLEHEQRAKRILERHSGEDVHVHELSAETYLAASPQAGDLERALLDPTAVFKVPEQVLQRDDFSHEQKAAILRRWAYDARELGSLHDARSGRRLPARGRERAADRHDHRSRHRGARCGRGAGSPSRNGARGDVDERRRLRSHRRAS
jgi:hypothetical protein